MKNKSASSFVHETPSYLWNPKENQDCANTPDQDEDRFQGQDITEVTDEPKVNCRYADEFSIGHGEIEQLQPSFYNYWGNNPAYFFNCPGLRQQL